MTRTILLTIISSLLFTLSGCKREAGIERLIMPENNYKGVTRLDRDLIIKDATDLSKEPEMIQMLAEVFKEAGIGSAANVAYVFEDEFNAIDVKIYEYLNSDFLDQAIARKYTENFEVDLIESFGIGDRAFIAETEITKGMAFFVDSVEVTLTTLNKDMDIEAFATTYSQWLIKSLSK